MVTAKCPQCGEEISYDNSRDFSFCSYCGFRIENSKPEPELENEPEIRPVYEPDAEYTEENISKEKEKLLIQINKLRVAHKVFKIISKIDTITTIINLIYCAIFLIIAFEFAVIIFIAIQCFIIEDIKISVVKNTLYNIMNDKIKEYEAIE